MRNGIRTCANKNVFEKEVRGWGFFKTEVVYPL